MIPGMRAALVRLSILLVLFAGAGAARADETLYYHWHLEGFLGALASLFFPAGGEGELSLHAKPDGRLESELLVTSREAKSGEYFRYGAEWEPATGRAVRAWSSYRWRGEEKARKSKVDQVGVVDIVSAIYVLRNDPPKVARRLEIWSDGRLYPVVVIPRGGATVQVEGHDVHTRHYSVRGIDLPDRRLWKGQFDLWIADDEAATPVEILVVQRGLRLRLELASPPPVAASPAAPE